MIFLRQLTRFTLKLNSFSTTKPFGYPTICSRSIHKTASPQLQTNRKVFGAAVRPAREEHFKTKDKVGDQFRLIYKAPMEYYVAISKHFATFSLTVVSGLIAVNIAKNTLFLNWGIGYTIDAITLDTAESMGFGGLLLMFNFMILYASWKYPLRIYKHKNSYIAIFEGILPFRPTQFHFQKGELYEASRNILPWRDSMYKMRTKSVLLLDHYFRTPSELHIMIKRK